MFLNAPEVSVTCAPALELQLVERFKIDVVILGIIGAVFAAALYYLMLRYQVFFPGFDVKRFAVATIPASHTSSIQSSLAAQRKDQAGSAEPSENITTTPEAREKQRESLRSKLAGVFVATLCGIGAALLILLVGAPFLRSAADCWLSAVEDAGRLVIVPALPRPPTRIQDILLEELQRRIATVASAWESTLRGPASALAEAAENSRRSVEAATQAFDGLRISIDDLKALGQSATRIRSAAQSIEATAKVYVNASQGLEAAVKSLEVTLPTLTVDLRSLVARLEGLEGALVSGTRSVAASGDTLREVVAKMGTDFHGLQEAVASRHARESAFLEHTEQLVGLIQNRLNSLASVEQDIKVQAGEMNTAVASVGLAVAHALDPLHNSIAGAIRQTLGELLQTHSDGLTAVLIEMRQESAATAALLEQIRSGREGIIVATGEIVTRANVLRERSEELDQVAQQVGTLLSALNGLSSAVHQLIQSGVVAHPEPDFLTALSRSLEEASVQNVSTFAASLTQVQRSVTRVEEGVSRFGALVEGPQEQTDGSFWERWTQRRRASRGRSG